MTMFGRENPELNDAYDNLESYIKRMRENDKENEAIERIMECVAYVLKK